MKVGRQNVNKHGGLLYVLDDGYVLTKIDKVDPETKLLENSVISDNYSSKYLGKSCIRNSTRKQQFFKPPVLSNIYYAGNKELFDEYGCNVERAVIVKGCWRTNKHVLKSQMVPTCESISAIEYPTMENCSVYDETVKAVLRKLKVIGKIPSCGMQSMLYTQVSPHKNPGFRYQEEYSFKTKGDAAKSAFKLAKARWKYVTKSALNKLRHSSIYPGVYTIGARNKRDMNYEDGELANSRVVHMPEFHCELTSAPWCDRLMHRFKNIAKGPIYLGNSMLDWMRLDKDIYDSKYVLEGDWKKFDSSLYVKLITIALCVIRCFYPHNSSYVDKHFIAMYDTLVIKDYYIPGGRVFRCFQGLPSGVKATSIINSIINLIILVHIVGAKFSKKFNFIVGGDDFLVSSKTDKVSPTYVEDRFNKVSSISGMHLKLLKLKYYEAANIEDCPVFYKYTIYKGGPCVPTSAVLERVFIPWNKKYDSYIKLHKFLIDVMPSLGRPMSHLYFYYDYLQLVTKLATGLDISIKDIVKMHKRTYDKMMSKKLRSKLFEYKNSKDNLNSQRLLISLLQENSNSNLISDFINRIESASFFTKLEIRLN